VKLGADATTLPLATGETVMGADEPVLESDANSTTGEQAEVNLDDLRQTCKVLVRMIEGGELLVFDYLQTQSHLLSKAAPADYRRMQTALQQYDFDEAAIALADIMHRHNIVH